MDGHGGIPCHEEHGCSVAFGPPGMGHSLGRRGSRPCQFLFGVLTEDEAGVGFVLSFRDDVRKSVVAFFYGRIGAFGHFEPGTGAFVVGDGAFLPNAVFLVAGEVFVEVAEELGFGQEVGVEFHFHRCAAALGEIAGSVEAIRGGWMAMEEVVGLLVDEIESVLLPVGAALGPGRDPI